ncbi:hypothetical protein FKM82_028250 [Ascaphus truei]
MSLITLRSRDLQYSVIITESAMSWIMSWIGNELHLEKFSSKWEGELSYLMYNESFAVYLPKQIGGSSQTPFLHLIFRFPSSL